MHYIIIYSYKINKLLISVLPDFNAFEYLAQSLGSTTIIESLKYISVGVKGGSYGNDVSSVLNDWGFKRDIIINCSL